MLIIGTLLLTFPSMAAEGILWQKMSPDVFTRAQAENKLVLLNLEANWCHWCHVMHDVTYSNPTVIDYVNAHYIAVQADQDANPELSMRYRNYGWPATVILNPKGEDIVKRAGFLKPNVFLKLLKTTVKNPIPEEDNLSLAGLSGEAVPNKGLIKELQGNFLASLDYKMGGFSQNQKYVEWDTYEYALFFSKNPVVKTWIEKSVEGAKQLSDPAWGGIYQYSTHNDWKHLHFEKLLSIQARYIKIFVYDFLYNKDENSLEYAQKIVAYCKRFLLHDNGLLSNAQDADLIKGKHAEDYFKRSDAERIKLGIPLIDTNTFTHNNAEMASALVLLYAATESQEYLEMSKKIIAQLSKRLDSNGLFWHTSRPKHIISLRDNLAFADALVQHIKIDGENIEFKQMLHKLVVTMHQNFALKNGAYLSFIGENGLKSEPIISENIKVARILNWYSYYSGDEKFKTQASNIYAFLTHRKVAARYYNEPALLALHDELQSEPNQFVFLELEQKENLLLPAIAFAPFHSLFMQNSREELPDSKRELFSGFHENVLLICTSNSCSSPIFSVEAVLGYFGR